MRTQKELRDICSNFLVYGDFLVAAPFGTGHINDTYQLTYDQGGIRLHYTLQRINRNVFRNPGEVMDNIERITDHLLRKIRAKNLETKKRTLRLLRTGDGASFVTDASGDCWRAYVFVENARSYDVLEQPRQAFEIARAFGEFQNDLVDLPGERLFETIPDFHNTPKRVETFEEAVRADRMGRAKDVSREIDFVLSRRDDAGRLLKLNAEGAIPERITHNDTKCNNILIDDQSGHGICVIDLDTVMPGLSLYDFGDIIRAGVNPAEEDETNLDKVEMRFDMYEAALEGFLSSADGFLTDAEREHLPFAGKLITFETGMRFLTDHLNGDVYFKIRHPGHNLERCRCQFKLVESLEKNMDRMKSLLRRPRCV